jgi:hypothetical protein
MVIDITNFDLTKNLHGKLKVFEFPPMPVQVHIELDIPDKKQNSLLLQKMHDAGSKKLQELQKLFTDEMTKIDARVAAAAAKDPGSVNLPDEQHTADVVSKQIAMAVPAHVEAACKKVYTDMQAAHKELTKYQLKCFAKIAWAAVKLTVAGLRLGVSHGADVSAWISAGKEVYAIATVFYELAKSADTLQIETGKEYDGLVQAVAKVKQSTGGKIVVAARQIADVEPRCKKVEGKVGVLRPKITGMDEKSHSLSGALDKLLDAQEKTRGKLNTAAEAKAQKAQEKVMSLINQIETSQVKVREMRGYADAITLSVQAFRRDYTKAVASSVKVVDFAKTMSNLYNAAKEVTNLVKEVVSLAT